MKEMDPAVEIAVLRSTVSALEELLKEYERSVIGQTERLEQRAHELERVNQELRQTQGRLVQSQKMEAVGLLAAGVAHELNNPLQAILNCTDLLRQRVQTMSVGEPRTPEEKQMSLRLLGTITDASARSAKIVRNLLAFARRDAQRKTTVDVGALLRSTVEFLDHPLHLQNVRVETRFAPGLPAVQGNPVALQQVFTNLLLNAKDAMGEGGTVTLRAQQVDGHVEISVRDSGCGMGPDVKARLFEPFFTTKSPGEGTGLGLSVAYGIVKEHGGSIGVESEPGMGSTFRVRLPVPGSGGPAPGGGGQAALEGFG